MDDALLEEDRDSLSVGLPRVNALLVASRWSLTQVKVGMAPVAEAGRWLLARIAVPYAITPRC